MRSYKKTLSNGETGSDLYLTESLQLFSCECKSRETTWALSQQSKKDMMGHERHGDMKVVGSSWILNIFLDGEKQCERNEGERLKNYPWLGKRR